MEVREHEFPALRAGREESIGTSLFLKTHHPGLDLILIVSLAAVVGLALATALILEYPFSGSVAVSSEPLIHGPLGQLVQQYR